MRRLAFGVSEEDTAGVSESDVTAPSAPNLMLLPGQSMSLAQGHKAGLLYHSIGHFLYTAWWPHTA
jgi:hypothetical protein